MVDDSEATLEVLRRNPETEGYVVYTASSVAEALHVLVTTEVDLVITDEELLSAVCRAIERVEMRRVSGQTGRHAVARHGLLGESDAMETIFARIERASSTRATVLVSGESGTGGELVARAIRYEGKRASAPFVPVNCGAIPHELLESELFGHIKGAFTGATETRAGLFLAADGGTVFLDEVGETSQAMQVKLLRVLQDSEVRMVGSSRPRNVDVRIIAATNKELTQLVRKGSFREDLYFRINVLPIHLPPLRERSSDIIRLTLHFASRCAEELGRPVTSACTWGWKLARSPKVCHGRPREPETLARLHAWLREASSKPPGSSPAPLTN